MSWVAGRSEHSKQTQLGNDKPEMTDLARQNRTLGNLGNWSANGSCNAFSAGIAQTQGSGVLWKSLLKEKGAVVIVKVRRRGALAQDTQKAEGKVSAHLTS